MEYCCHAVAPSCYFEMLDKLLKGVCRTVVPSLAASFEPMAHRRKEASFFCRYYFGRCSMELADQVQFLIRGRTSHSDRLHDFSVTIPRCS